MTTTVFIDSSPELVFGQQSAEPFDSTVLIWMSLFILFLVLTIAAVTMSIYLACVLKRKRTFRASSEAEAATFVKTNSLCKSL